MQKTATCYMLGLHLLDREYGWEKNAGYGTPDHLKAIEEHGICKYHRQSFKPIKEYLKRRGTTAA